MVPRATRGHNASNISLLNGEIQVLQIEPFNAVLHSESLSPDRLSAECQCKMLSQWPIRIILYERLSRYSTPENRSAAAAPRYRNSSTGIQNDAIIECRMKLRCVTPCTGVAKLRSLLQIGNRVHHTFHAPNLAPTISITVSPFRFKKSNLRSKQPVATQCYPLKSEPWCQLFRLTGYTVATCPGPWAP